MGLAVHLVRGAGWTLHGYLSSSDHRRERWESLKEFARDRRETAHGKRVKTAFLPVVRRL